MKAKWKTMFNVPKEKLAVERGITLLALIITVVILIILAAVAINITLNSGLINQAKQAGEDTMQAAKDEQQMLEDAASYINGILADTNKAKTLVQAFKDGEIQVGDYVDYTPDPHDPVTVGTDKTGFTDSEGRLGTTDQTYSQDTTNTHWRVLGLTEDGNSVMLLGSPIKQDGASREEQLKYYLHLEGATGYKNCETTLNEICSIYHNNNLAQETRSIKIEDINRALGGITVTYPEEGEPGSGTVTLNTDGNRTNIGEVTYYPSYTYQSGDYSPESYPSEVSSQIGQEVQANSYDYYITDEKGINYRFLQSLSTTINERAYNMLFETTTVSGKAKPYWLASSGVSAHSDNAVFCPGYVSDGDVAIDNYYLFDSDGIENADYYAVRPVVILKSGVTVDDVHKIEDQTEEKWLTTIWDI